MRTSSTDGKPSTVTLELEEPRRSSDSAALLAPKTQRRGYLGASVSLNILLLFVLLFQAAAARWGLGGWYTANQGGSQSPPSVPTDGSRAACGGNGMLFADESACRCFDCWAGLDCSERLTGDACVVMANSGTPYIFEDYWIDRPEASITILPSYHLGYSTEPVLPRLEAAIRALHALVGNAVTEGKHIVVGLGSTELISAALYALSDSDPSASPAAVFAERPYYSGYRMPSLLYGTRLFEWWDNATAPVPSVQRKVIELVTSPNNPDGHLRSPIVRGEHACAVMDHAYLWPHFTAVGPPVDYGNHTVALFTLSKMTGHASSRIGWAIASDARVARRLQQFVSLVTFGAPRENQLRAIAVLEHVLQHDGDNFRYARALMLSRWRRLGEAFNRPGAAFRLQARDPPGHDGFSGETAYESSPAYAWVEQLDGGDALTSMRSVGVIGRAGDQFGASSRYVRLELLMREETFELMVAKLVRLVDSTMTATV
jgi:aspartate/methionine/tyrosine aminotransferase